MWTFYVTVSLWLHEIEALLCGKMRCADIERLLVILLSIWGGFVYETKRDGENSEISKKSACMSDA